ncbi:MAG TPA: UbiA family prenyltransferase [Gemmatimonadaceae bacterium]|nr:UbiA family prenyltransferase [Gemmatimonadaceae bacterium]
MPSPLTIARALRVHQWPKNLLVFVAPALAHRIADRAVLADAGSAFVAFCLVASAGYLFNDMWDRGADRTDPEKQTRPIASGELTVRTAMFLAAPLFVAGVLIAFAMSAPRLAWILIAYALASATYTTTFKRIVIVDVLVLALLYSLRVLGGGVAAQTPVSAWLLGFSTFFFLSLAFVKRYSELQRVAAAPEVATRRGYAAADVAIVRTMGLAAGYQSVLILALYLNSSEVIRLYRTPSALWLVCPLVLYWISRLWLRAHRGQLHSDPLVFALADPVSYMLGVATVLVVAGATMSFA